MEKSTGKCGRIVGALVGVALLVAAAAPVSAGIGNAGNPRVLPPQSHPFGSTYAQWGAEWWQWVFSIPFANNPLLDPTGADCDEGQSGPVWFLAGTTGGSVVRSCSVPTGKAIFFPIFNTIADYPCPPEFGFEPPPGQSLEDFLTDTAKGIIDLVDVLEVEVDGVPLKNLFAYRATSSMFTFTGDPSLAAIDPCITGTPQPGVSDGYWIMLPPLSKGQHTLHILGAISSWEFAPETTWNLTIVPGKP